MSENEKIDGTEQDLSLAGDKPQKKEKKANKKDEKPSLFQRMGRWFRDMKSELKKVMWPTPKQTMNNTLIVIACVIMIGIFIWAFDWLAGAVYRALLSLVGKI